MIYYERNGITIHHGDCNDILPKIGSVDIMITDPPYGMNYVSGRRKEKHLAIVGDDSLPVDSILEAINKAEKAAYVFCRWSDIPLLLAPKSVIVWVKNNHTAGDLKHEHARKWEAICFYPKAKHQFAKRISDVITAAKTNNNIHPTEKPVSLIAQLIQCNYGDIVLDPYMGSGTTLVAAKMLGRKAIGIEIEERYCETAAIRLEQSDALF